MTVDAVLARRRGERARRIDTARRFASAIPASADVQAVVVFGSVARGDFNAWSDIDVLVLANAVPDTYLERVAAVGMPPPGVQAVVWTTAEWHTARRKENRVAIEAASRGVILRGALPPVD